MRKLAQQRTLLSVRRCVRRSLRSSRRAGRDCAQRLPHALLKRSSPHIEGQIETQRRRLDKTDDLGHQVLEILIIVGELCYWKAALKVTHQSHGIVAEEDRADAPLGG